MPWVPTTDFEEEIVNLQPDHDFIYGALSQREPQPAYPRPKAHIEFAATQKKDAKKQQELYETTGRMNQKLHVITQVQRIAGTKPLGEQATVNDWDSYNNVEKETVGMLRYYGMGPSVEEPLNEEVTIASYPIDNNLHATRNGRKKIPVFFDENAFKLQPKVSNSSSGFESSNSNDESLENKSTDTSFNTSLSSFNTSNSFYTGENDSENSNASMTAYNKAQVERQNLLLRAERMKQYDKLQETVASLSLSNNTEDYDSFKTAKDYNSWTPNTTYDNYDEDEHFIKNKYNWPTLQNTKTLNNSKSSKTSTTNTSVSSNNTNKSCNNGTLDSSLDQYSSDCSASNTTESSSLYQRKSKNFLDRFVKPDHLNTSETSSNVSEKSSTSSSPIVPSSYADMARTVLPSPSQGGAKPKTKKVQQKLMMPKFYSAREVYERKRHATTQQ